jgi:hypothetical protein
VITPEILRSLESETNGLIFGMVRVEFFICDGRLSRYTICREMSCIPEDAQSVDSLDGLNKKSNERATTPVVGMRKERT